MKNIKIGAVIVVICYIIGYQIWGDGMPVGEFTAKATLIVIAIVCMLMGIGLAIGLLVIIGDNVKNLWKGIVKRYEAWKRTQDES